MNEPQGPKIVVGVDGSGGSSSALRWATSLAEELNGTVSAVMAWNYPTALLMPVVGSPVVPADFMAESARQRLDEVIAATPKATTVAEQWVVMGSPRGVLTEASEDHDLLVVGRTGSGRLRQLLLGSTASYCVRHAECPVVVTRDSIEPEENIVVAVDGSPTSIEALVWAIRLGDRHQILAVYSHDEWELDDLPLEDDVRSDLDSRADAMLAEAVQTAVDRTGCDEARLKRQIRQGDPRTTLVDQADPGDLLVLGSQGYSGVARWMLGSLADYAVQHAPGTLVIWR